MEVFTLEKIWELDKNLRIKTAMDCYKNGVLEKEQEFIVKNKNFSKAKKLANFLNENNLKYSLKNIWKMKKESLKQISIYFEKYLPKNDFVEGYFEGTENFSENLLRVNVSLIYYKKGLIENFDLKYVEDENFQKNFLYTEHFDEGIKLFNFFKDDKQALKYLFNKKMPSKPSQLDKNPEKTISDYNIKLFKKYVAKFYVETFIKKISIFYLLKNFDFELITEKIIDYFYVRDSQANHYFEDLINMYKNDPEVFNIIIKNRDHLEFSRCKKENYFIIKDAFKFYKKYNVNVYFYDELFDLLKNQIIQLIFYLFENLYCYYEH